MSLAKIGKRGQATSQNSRAMPGSVARGLTVDLIYHVLDFSNGGKYVFHKDHDKLFVDLIEEAEN